MSRINIFYNVFKPVTVNAVIQTANKSNGRQDEEVKLYTPGTGFSLDDVPGSLRWWRDNRYDDNDISDDHTSYDYPNNDSRTDDDSGPDDYS